MHLFDTKRLKHLDDPQRLEQIPVNSIASDLGLKDGLMMADIGCGSGLFSYAFADYVKPNGRLVGFDIQKPCIDHCENKKSKGYEHMSFVLNDTESIKAEDGSFDAAVMIQVAHEIPKLRDFLHEVNRILRPHARLAIVEWQAKKTENGPPVKERIAPNALEKLLNKAGFKVVKNEPSSENHYLIIAAKN